MKDKKVEKGMKTSIGGQALLEGIMMRGPKKTTMAVRNPDGEIVLEDCDVTAAKRPKITKAPFIRGVFNMYDSLKLGYKCLMRSAEIGGLEDAEAEIAREKEEKKRAKAAKKAGISPDTAAAPAAPAVPAEQEPEAPVVYAEPAVNATDAADAPADDVKEIKEEKEAPEAKEGKKSGSGTTTAVMIVSTVLGLTLAVLLFVYLPTFISSLFLGKNAAEEHPVWLAVISGVIKIAILVGYMAAVSLMKDIKRTFMYHGAEHKSIFCYEHGYELTVENVKRERRFHPRCGTSFLFLMVFVGVVIMIPIGLLLKIWLPAGILEIKALYTLIRTGIAVLLLPIMAGIGYELIRVAGRHDNILTKIISAPGLWLQRITTKEPDDSMIECAIAALKAVIPSDGSDKW